MGVQPFVKAKRKQQIIQLVNSINYLAWEIMLTMSVAMSGPAPAGAPLYM